MELDTLLILDFIKIYETCEGYINKTNYGFIKKMENLSLTSTEQFNLIKKRILYYIKNYKIRSNILRKTF